MIGDMLVEEVMLVVGGGNVEVGSRNRGFESCKFIKISTNPALWWDVVLIYYTTTTN